MIPMILALCSVLTGISVLLTVSALFAFSQRRHSAVALDLFSLLLLLAIYSCAYSLELRSRTLEDILFWNKVEYFGISFLPAAWTILTARYVNFRPLLNKWVIAIMILASLTTLFSAITDPWLHLRYASIWLRTDTSIPILGFTRGILYWSHTVFSFASLFAGSVLLVRFISGSPALFRKQISLMLIGSCIPWVVYILYLTGYNFHGIDTIPFSMFISAICFGTAIFGFKILDVTPVARSVVFEMMSDGAIVLDTSDRLIDYNRAAVAAFPGLTPGTLSKRIEDILPEISEFHGSMNSWKSNEFRFSSGKDDDTQHYICHSTPVYDIRNRPVARVIVFKDNTSTVKLMEKLNELATIDPLTKLYNRRHFLDAASRRMSHLSRKSLPMSVILIDLDHFKSINDTYGHGAGDEALRMVAQIIMENIRADDTAARFGGEEFICFLPETDTVGAHIIAERMRKAIAKTGINFEAHTSITITASFGIAGTIPGKDQPIDAFIARADKALYTAKNGGRNRTAVFDDGSDSQ